MRDYPAQPPHEPRRPSPPLLVLCDVSLIRGCGDEATEPVIAGLRRAIVKARATGVPVAFCERNGLADRGWPESLSGCRPLPSDMLFERPGASCFTNPEFLRAARPFADSGLLFAGFGVETGILASVLDADALGLPPRILFDLCFCQLSQTSGSSVCMTAAAVIAQRLQAASRSDLAMDFRDML